MRFRNFISADVVNKGLSFGMSFGGGGSVDGRIVGLVAVRALVTGGWMLFRGDGFGGGDGACFNMFSPFKGRGCSIVLPAWSANAELSNEP